jgi:predicted DNA-binding protein YlxM (UPF0122 family)
MSNPEFLAAELKSKLVYLLEAFKTDELSLETIAEETELVRQKLYLVSWSQSDKGCEKDKNSFLIGHKQ